MPRLQPLTKLVPTCAILSLVTLTSCATMTASSVPTDKVACSSFLPIYWSKTDTDKTLAQIKEHNAAFVAICGPVATPKANKKASAKPTTFADRWYGGVKVVATAFR
jgi:hypothetical protein